MDKLRSAEEVARSMLGLGPDDRTRALEADRDAVRQACAEAASKAHRDVVGHRIRGQIYAAILNAAKVDEKRERLAKALWRKCHANEWESAAEGTRAICRACVDAVLTELEAMLREDADV